MCLHPPILEQKLEDGLKWMNETKEGDEEDEESNSMPTRLAKALGIVSLETRQAVEFLREDMEVVR